MGPQRFVTLTSCKLALRYRNILTYLLTYTRPINIRGQIWPDTPAYRWPKYTIPANNSALSPPCTAEGWNTPYRTGPPNPSKRPNSNPSPNFWGSGAVVLAWVFEGPVRSGAPHKSPGCNVAKLFISHVTAKPLVETSKQQLCKHYTIFYALLERITNLYLKVWCYPNSIHTGIHTTVYLHERHAYSGPNGLIWPRSWAAGRRSPELTR